VRPDRLFVSVLLLLLPVLGAPARELTERGTFKGHKFRVDRVELSNADEITSVPIALAKEFSTKKEVGCSLPAW